MKKQTAVAALLILVALSISAQEQDKSKRPSPSGTAQLTFADGKKVTIDYSRPFAKGRKIYGGLVPYDQVWRTGANEATSLKTDADLAIGGTTVPASARSRQDLARVDMNPTSLSQPVEQFTISFDKTGGDSGKLNLDWEKTRSSVDVKEKK